MMWLASLLMRLKDNEYQLKTMVLERYIEDGPRGKTAKGETMERQGRDEMRHKRCTASTFGLAMWWFCPIGTPRNDVHAKRLVLPRDLCR
jgi:hypothetical protein